MLCLMTIITKKQFLIIHTNIDIIVKTTSYNMSYQNLYFFVIYFIARFLLLRFYIA